MTPRPAACPHELRPGTKVCLHCRRAEREASAARHRQILIKTGVTIAVVGACVFGVISALEAWQARSGNGIAGLLATPAPLEAAPVPAPTRPAPAPVSGAPVSTPDSALAALPAPNTGSSTTPGERSAAAVSGIPTAEVSPAAPLLAASPAAAIRPVVAEGRTDLQNGIYALRSGDTVTVHFDTPEARTRRPAKFEQIVRATLPEVHGAPALAILGTIATGNLLAEGELISDEPPRAIALRAHDGRALSLLPQTRPGRDGPLVVAYRVTPAAR